MARLAVVLLGCLLISSRASADALRNVDRTTSGGGSSSSSSSSWSSDDDDDDDCGLLESCDSDDSFAASFFAYVFGSPWIVPRLFDHPELGRYAAYPFADGPGLLRPRQDSAYDTTRSVAIALDAESGYMLQRVVPSGLAVRLVLPYRFELDGRFSGLSDVAERPIVMASAGTAHLSYRFAQGRRFDFRTGLGLRTFAIGEVRLGFDFFYGVDSYLGPRVVWRIELHAGSAGDAFVGQARTTVGVMFQRFEAYAGYDHTAYLSEASEARLGGPIAGLRAWF